MWTPSPNPSTNPNPKAKQRMPNRIRIRTQIAVPMPPAASAPRSLTLSLSPSRLPLSMHSSSIHSRKMDRKIPISDVKRNCLIIVNQWKVASGRLSRLVATRVAPDLWQLRKSFEINKIWHRLFFFPPHFGQQVSGSSRLDREACPNAGTS